MHLGFRVHSGFGFLGLGFVFVSGGGLRVFFEVSDLGFRVDLGRALRYFHNFVLGCKRNSRVLHLP